MGIYNNGIMYGVRAFRENDADPNNPTKIFEQVTHSQSLNSYQMHLIYVFDEKLSYGEYGNCDKIRIEIYRKCYTTHNIEEITTPFMMWQPISIEDFDKEIDALVEKKEHECMFG
jgi:hypothetical protein